MDLRVPGARSLKDKRRVVKSLKERLHNRYNCSIAETEFKEQWGRARLVACVVGDDSRHVNTQLNEIVRFASAKQGAELLDYHIEML
ncbi:MAG: DUF503 domain-containing protein [Candidatus Hydrogenedentes bacterium]|nr:DUF503 domain-containing protein [Candidatus Hydrogenedentota bacterium]